MKLTRIADENKRLIKSAYIIGIFLSGCICVYIAVTIK
ncbi:putative membrane protein [Morganella morganii]|nr:putative membrane protein [Morganella morganii]